MPACGSQCYRCDFPVRFDTYAGCGHACRYCFANRYRKLHWPLRRVSVGEGIMALMRFVGGGRGVTTNWADWDIPIHFGGVSDPFQPVEERYRRTYYCLRILAGAKYPFIISTKGRLAASDEYLNALEDCNCVFQLSAVCGRYDAMEPGAPPFRERLWMMRRIAPRVKRLIVRIQPYRREVLPDVYENLARFRDAGAYGVIVEGMKFFSREPGYVRLGAYFCYPYDAILKDFLLLRERAHGLGLRIFAGENRLRALGDSLSCCGAEGLEGFAPNVFNLNHLLNGDNTTPTPGQQVVGTAHCFSALDQTTAYTLRLKKLSFAAAMLDYYRTHRKSVDLLMGLRR